jgi:uncharacterized OB-fold protein
MARERPVREGLFTIDDEPRLIAGRCRMCGRHHFPRSSTCSYCGADAVDDALLHDMGTLWAWTAVTSAPPGYRGDVPYGFGVVELPDGIRVVTRIDVADPERLTFGMPVKLALEPLGVDDDGATVLTYTFVPAVSA